MTAIVLRGDARRLPLPDASVDLICTSPPYWALRDYRDGDASMAGQIGSEPTPQEWVAALVECTAEWARVLKPAGSIFVNLGDKYSSGAGAQTGEKSAALRMPHGRSGGGTKWATVPAQPPVKDAPPKSLLGLPWRYALACTDQLGLILRRDIVWSKPNGLPESVTDRCRSSHEYVFHLVKQPRYYAAVDEIREPQATSPTRYRLTGANGANPAAQKGYRNADRGYYTAETEHGRDYNPLGKLPGSVWRMPADDTVWDIPSQPLTVPAHLGVDHFAAFPVELPRRCVLGWSPPGICTSCGEGRRPVTQLGRTAGFGNLGNGGKRDAARDDGQRGTHEFFSRATERFNRLATITGYACACTPCTDHPGTGEPSGPYGRHADAVAVGTYENVGSGWGGKSGLGDRPRVGPWREYHFDGWTPPPTRPAVVLDPFAGTGTTLLAAAAYGRVGIGVDLSADYCRLARWRVSDPGERAKAMQVPKPPPVPDGMEALF